LAFALSLFQGALAEKKAVYEVLKTNDLAMKYGLVLTEKQAMALVEIRFFALRENGRIEFGGGVIDKMINKFCSSPYLNMENYEETLHGLLELFYYYKNETMDLMSDEDLLQYMEEAFDGICQGSVELLGGRELYRMARNLRCGYPADYRENGAEGDGEEEEEYGYEMG